MCSKVFDFPLPSGDIPINALFIVIDIVLLWTFYAFMEH